MRPLGKVKIQWSRDFAYAVGLLATDGHLSKDGRHIDFTSQDRELVVLFLRSLGIKGHVGEKSSGSSDATCYRTQFGDVLFYRWLVDIGITPQKSKTIQMVIVPDKYFFDFMRGCFDGDGSIYSYFDPRWRSSFMFYLTIASASRPFLEWTAHTAVRLCGARGRIRRSDRVWQLTYAKKTTQLLWREMYRGHPPCLKRKLVKGQKIFTMNNVR